MTSLVRLPDWRKRLFRTVGTCSRLPLKPGVHDCALFAAACVEAQTGQDFARGWRGYRSLAAGRRRLVEKGFESEIDLVASILPARAPALAQLGDVAVVEEDGAEALAVVQGAYLWTVGTDGLGLVERHRAIRCFTV